MRKNPKAEPIYHETHFIHLRTTLFELLTSQVWKVVLFLNIIKDFYNYCKENMKN